VVANDDPVGGLAAAREFATTHWSVVLAAGDIQSPEATAALERLCRTYWFPLYAYIRRRGHEPADAQDLTQSFFARLLQKNYPAQADRAKGKFRSFLLFTLNHFLSDEADKARTQKRGGGQSPISLDAEQAEERYRREPVDDVTPDKVFERRWALALLQQAAARLDSEHSAGDRFRVYSVLRQFLPGEQTSLSYAEAAARLDLPESAVKSQIWRLRRRYRDLVREEIAHTVATVSEVDDELRYLLNLVSG
jgi:RNA polymerase sigma factor (sigma-70 family)